MAILKNNVDGYLKIGGQWKFVKVLKKFTLVSTNEVMIWYASGMRTKTKRIPEKFCDTMILPIWDLFAHPCGIRMALKNPDAVKFVSMCRIVDFEDMKNELDRMSDIAEKSIYDKDRTKKDIDKKLIEIEALKKEQKELISEIRELAQRK